MIKKLYKVTAIIWLVIITAISPVLAADIVDDVDVKTLSDGYEVKVNFLFPLRYTGSVNDGERDDVLIQLKPINFQALTQEEIDIIAERVRLSWDRNTGIPLQELTFDGDDPERPILNFVFSERVKVDIRSSVDLRSLIVTIKTRVAPVPDRFETEDGAEVITPPVIDAPEVVIPEDATLAELMGQARQAMAKSDHNRAIQLYTKILRTADGVIKKQAQELLGLSRERNKQFAHAKAEYKKFLEEFPEGVDADRVKQRLAGLITATKKPKALLKEGERKTGDVRVAAKASEWDKRYYGSLSQFYFYDQTTPEGGETQVNRSDINTDMDVNSRWRSTEYDIRAKFSGGYRHQLKEDEDNEKRVSSLSFEVAHKPKGVFGKVGRQTRTSGGVLGRFDGAHTSYEINEDVKINGVFGFPVESTRNTNIDTSKMFYGMSADFGTYKEKWDFNTFAIMQTNEGLTDRQAIGGEVRYFTPKQSFFTLVDYDVFYNDLNIFLFNGSLSVLDKTIFNLVLDRRKSPLLTTNNAIQGQGVLSIAELKGILSESELKSLAADRSATNTSGTIGITHNINEDTQITAELTASELSGTPASGGVEAAPGTGVEYYYSGQLIKNNTFIENDSIIYGLRYSDAQSSNTYTMTVNGKFPYNKDLRFIPKLRMDYRTEPDNSDKRTKIRPVMRADYRLKKWLRMEAEAGGEWVNEKSSGVDQKSKELFLMMGYRANF